jgi:hypothetical protein
MKLKWILLNNVGHINLMGVVWILVNKIVCCVAIAHFDLM